MHCRSADTVVQFGSVHIAVRRVERPLEPRLVAVELYGSCPIHLRSQLMSRLRSRPEPRATLQIPKKMLKRAPGGVGFDKVSRFRVRRRERLLWRR